MMGRIESLVFIILGAVGVVDGLRIAAELRTASINDPIGPDRYLIIVAGLLFVLALVQLVLPSRRMQSVSAEANAEPNGSFSTVAHLTIALIAYAAVLPFFGYALATLLFFVAAFWIMGVRTIWVNAAGSIVGAAAAHALFQRAADMALPTSPLGF